MKAKALQLGKAMSAALFVLLLVVAGMKNVFAQTQVATLQHGDDVSAFYGANAFVEAHTAAVNGDIITLSSGTFTPCDITKAITLRGAGCSVDTEVGTNPTLFGSTIGLNVAADTVNSLSIEGVLFSNQVRYRNLYAPKFNRCIFTEVYTTSSSGESMENATFINCIIDRLYFNGAKNTVLINSVVCRPQYFSELNSVVLYNSIIVGSSGNYQGLSAYNSIVIRTNVSYPYSSCTFINCIGINLDTSTGYASNYGPFGQGYTAGCTTYTSYEEVFESFSGVFSMDETFVLKEEVATGFLGSDGTQVGIYGGMLPYNPRPSYMVLKRCNVAGRSTIDGKLSVDIEVVTEE